MCIGNKARQLIEALQPYNAADPLNDPLFILHDFNRTDKHQTLALIETRFGMTLSIPLSSFSWMIGLPDIDYKRLAETLATNKPKMEFSIYIAFAKFGKRENQSVIPSLTQLANFTADVVRQFSQL